MQLEKLVVQHDLSWSRQTHSDFSDELYLHWHLQMAEVQNVMHVPELMPVEHVSAPEQHQY